MSDSAPRLSLGTAQWGTRYGITNAKGELSDVDVAGIVQTALDCGIRDADTHRTTNPRQGYGRAQSRLRPWAGEFAVTTKVLGGVTADLPVGQQLAESLPSLSPAQVHACLVHDWALLSGDERRSTARALEAMRASGQSRKVGASAYDEAEIANAIEHFESLDVVQIPASVEDQRLVNSAVLHALKDAGAEIQVRSIFLQGLLLEPRATASLAAHPDIRRFHLFCEENVIAPLAACLRFTRSLEWATEVVVGVTGADEGKQIAAILAQVHLTADWAELASSDTALVDPRVWARL